jgi:hypothetical protein
MKSPFVRRKHVDLGQALTAISDPTIPTRDAMVMWRKALRRANHRTKELLDVARLHSKKRRVSHEGLSLYGDAMRKTEL